MCYTTLKSCILLSVAAACSACAYAPHREPDGNPAATPYHAVRAATGSAHAGWLLGRSVYENPVNRPVSHVTSLASLALKSTGGMLRRVAINTTQLPSLAGEIPAINTNVSGMDLEAFEAKLDRVTGTRRDLGRIRFLVDGDEYFCRLIRAINAAEDSVDIRTYIFDNDDFATTIADRLKVRSEDIRVRIMVDGLGTMQAMHADPASLPSGYKAPLSMRVYLQSNSDVKFRSNTNPWLTGDHTKTTVIDGKTAFVGGMNIGREYRYDWHDLMMEITGPVVDQLQHESDKAWARAGLLGDLANVVTFIRGKKRLADADGYPIRVLQTRNFDSDIHKAQLAAIQSARRYILIENPYFSDDRTVYELAKARRRGVDVRVILPVKGNHEAMNSSNRVTVNQLLKHGIRVYEYPGMSHVKAAVFDGWASVGSANLDKLSLKVNKELNIATSDPATVSALLQQVFIPDLMQSREVKAPYALTVANKLAEIAVDEVL
jgi:phosphatidylserine/phosphatidylglycerophosphate/cardiolipin synthase-like enzyme